MTREEILNSRNFGVKEIEIPDLGKVFIRKWSGAERAKFLKASIAVNDGDVNVNFDNVFDNMFLAATLSLCNELGERMFKDNEVELVSGINGDIIQAVYQESLKLNKLSQASLEESAKNSKPVLSEDSTSSLPGNSDAQ
jgi:hypothetical protein